MTSTATLQSKRSTLLITIKWFFLVSTSTYLCYKLITYTDYAHLFYSFSDLSIQRVTFLALAIFLVPLNLFLEVQKWRFLVSKTISLSFIEASKAVLAGFSTGFATPNRLGEIAGRMLFVKPEHRKITACYTLLNGLTQNIIIATLGIPAALLFWNTQHNADFITLQHYGILAATLLVFAIGFYLLLPRLVASKLIGSKLLFLSDIQKLNKSDLLQICVFTLIRYFVFAIQMYFILHFFNVQLSLIQALISIPTSYLFITLVPTFAFSEVSVRSSMAVFFIGAFCSNTAGIALAGLVVWLLNFALPMLVGLKIIANIK